MIQTYMGIKGAFPSCSNTLPYHAWAHLQNTERAPLGNIADASKTIDLWRNYHKMGGLEGVPMAK